MFADFETVDITSAFHALTSALAQIIVWNQTHFIRLGAYEVSFFDIEIVCIVAAIIIAKLPIWGDDMNIDSVYDDEGEPLWGSMEDSDFDYDDFGDW